MEYKSSEWGKKYIQYSNELLMHVVHEVLYHCCLLALWQCYKFRWNIFWLCHKVAKDNVIIIYNNEIIRVWVQYKVWTLSSQVWCFLFCQHKTECTTVHGTLGFIHMRLTGLLRIGWWRPYENFGFPTLRIELRISSAAQQTNDLTNGPHSCLK